MRAYVCNLCRDNPVGETRPKRPAGRLLEWFKAFPENVTERTITGIQVQKKKRCLYMPWFLLTRAVFISPS